MIILLNQTLNFDIENLTFRLCVKVQTIFFVTHVLIFVVFVPNQRG